MIRLVPPWWRRGAALAALALLAACGPAADTPAPASGGTPPPATAPAGRPAGQAPPATVTAAAPPDRASAGATGAPAPAAGTPEVPGTVPPPVASSIVPRSPTAAPAAPAAGPARRTVGIDCVAPVLKRHPIDLAPYDSTSGRAGDAAFVRPVFLNRIFNEFGFVIPASSSATGAEKANPQPTYLAPRGTKVRSTVDGVVDRISELWSTSTLGDLSVMVKPDGLPDGCYVVVEFEHVVDVAVRVGERVTAGQVIAEVGPLNSQASQGLGLVELGILTGAGDGRPLHVCPYAYFHPTVRDAQLGALARLIADWEAYAGDTSLYNEAGWASGVTGCRGGPIKE